MAVTNLFSLLDDDDSGDDLDALVARRAATVVPSTPAPKQSKSSQPKASEPKAPGHLERGRLPGSGRGRFFGTEGEKVHYRRFIDGQNPVSKPVKRVVEESEEVSGQWSAVARRNGGRPFYESENWGRYYRDCESQWWYLDGEGRLWSEQGGAAIYGDRGRYYQEGDGRWWFMDSEMCWWAEHGGPVVNFHTEEELKAAAAAYAKWKSEHGWDRSQKSYTVEELRDAAAAYREWKYEQFRDIIQKGSVKSQRGSVKSQGSFKSQKGSVKSQQGSVKSNRKFESEQHVNKSVSNVETEHQANRAEGQKVDNEASSGEAKPEGEKKTKKNKNKTKKTSDTASEKQELPKEDFRNRKTLAEYEKEREEKRKALEAMKAEERRVDTKEYEGMQVVRKSKKQEEEVAEYIMPPQKPPQKPGVNKGKAKAEKGKVKDDQKTPVPQVLSINEFLKDFKPSNGDVREGNSSVRGQNVWGDRLNYNSVQANSNGSGYKGGYSNGNGQDNRFQGRNSDRNGASYNGDRRGGNANYSGTSYSGDRRGGNSNSNGTGYNGGGYQAQGRYSDNNGGRYNGDRRSAANYDEEAARPATPVVRAAPPPPPPSVDDRAQFPSLSRVPKA